jgi:hypothetical protein
MDGCKEGWHRICRHAKIEIGGQDMDMSEGRMRGGVERMKDRARYKSVRGSVPPKAVPGPRSVPCQVLGGLLEGANGLAALPRRNQMEIFNWTSHQSHPRTLIRKCYDVVLKLWSIPVVREWPLAGLVLIPWDNCAVVALRRALLPRRQGKEQ